MLFSVSPIGFEGERKAVSLLILAFYLALYGLLALLSALDPAMGAFLPMCAALAACYGVSFFALGAGWFWARWFAVGLGLSGLTNAAFGVVMLRSLEPEIVFYGLTHGLIALCLQGERMVAQFDAQPAWRQRWSLDDAAVQRVRKAVTSAASSLPPLIVFALQPRQPTAALAVLGLATLGLVGLLSRRTWGVLVLGGAGVLGVSLALSAAGPRLLTSSAMYSSGSPAPGGLLLLGALFLVLSAAPFARPVARYLRG